MAVLARRGDVIRLLHSFGASLKACEKPPLVRAAGLNYTDLLPLLVELGAVLNEVHGLDMAALHEAVLHGNIEAVQTLLALGADVNVGRFVTPLV